LRVLGFLKGTIDDVLRLEADDTNTLNWYIDAASAVHEYMKRHTGAMFTMGKGAIIGSSTKQKVNSHSSTKSNWSGRQNIQSFVDERVPGVARVCGKIEYYVSE
jgi:hypothetical protein